ncbi:hypothetical protein A4X06_0g4737 [Tilletia controversa]|uniref:YABBY protein C-terminal domain-containing protein n=2 Tax=Tilletia TaxID=13289 RepID=A0A8X7SWC7_9BASI|nr:hypothetical protein CF328_g4942 [Tilletia controversa]KAE8247053.1 hypothetical protein A4X06_0g4737 [Tilletia controversa]KAE8257619.1 hypothetical protein A4X03_0g4609 [Tilletia caries]
MALGEIPPSPLLSSPTSIHSSHHLHPSSVHLNPPTQTLPTMPPKKTKSTTAKSTTGKKPSPYNVYMKTALAKLKVEKPDMEHKARFKLAAENWKNDPANPKRV